MIGFVCLRGGHFSGIPYPVGSVHGTVRRRIDRRASLHAAVPASGANIWKPKTAICYDNITV